MGYARGDHSVQRAPVRRARAGPPGRPGAERDGGTRVSRQDAGGQCSPGGPRAAPPGTVTVR